MTREQKKRLRDMVFYMGSAFLWGGASTYLPWIVGTAMVTIIFLLVLITIVSLVQSGIQMTIAEKITNDWLDGLLTQQDAINEAICHREAVQHKCYDTASSNPVVWDIEFTDGSTIKTPLTVEGENYG